VVVRRGRRKTVCARGAHPTWSSGPSTSPLDGPRVPLLDDVVRRVHESFSGSDRDKAAGLLLGARIHDGSLAEPRLQRCALVASQGSLETLQYYVKVLAVDFRDVIVAGEYESIAGELVRVRERSRSFDESV